MLREKLHTDVSMKNSAMSHKKQFLNAIVVAQAADVVKLRSNTSTKRTIASSWFLHIAYESFFKPNLGNY